MKLLAPRCRYPHPVPRPDALRDRPENLERRREGGACGHPTVVFKRWSKPSR
jgi:hypothetical protein